jgi:hypothetical protein
MLRGWIINCTRCTVHISKQKQLGSHGNYSKTANCLKKITAIFYRYVEFFAVCADVLRNPRLEKHCFRDKAQLKGLENTTQPLWVGRRNTKVWNILTILAVTRRPSNITVSHTSCVLGYEDLTDTQILLRNPPPQIPSDKVGLILSRKWQSETTVCFQNLSGTFPGPGLNMR